MAEGTIKTPDDAEVKVPPELEEELSLKNNWSHLRIFLKLLGERDERGLTKASQQVIEDTETDMKSYLATKKNKNGDSPEKVGKQAEPETIDKSKGAYIKKN